jgi:asparagine synthase (glutamine-hydrolysing)
MCGINGGYGVAKSVVEAMVAATAHRGPDATGFSSIGNVHLGHNRLSIIDVAARSNQPMRSPDGRYHLVFNGEIYNFGQLKQELSHWNFVTTGDTEVLLAALATWGLTTLDKLHGIFSFAWYDHVTDTLTLVRDHLGVKPMYYTKLPDGLAFSSELAGILACTNSRVLDDAALAHYFGGNYVPSPDSLIAGVQKLPPGHCAQYRDGQLTVTQYYESSAPTRTRVTNQDIRSVIGTTVQEQLISDRPVGVFLSGGIDSSIVLHHAAAAGKTRTFTTSFEMVAGGEGEYQKYNADAALAARTAAHYGCEHTEVVISLADMRRELIPSLARLDEPVANAVTPTQLMLSSVVRKAGIVVALGGDGGDELWGGYGRHQSVLAAQYVQSLPTALQSVVALHPTMAKLCIPVGPALHQRLTIMPAAKFNVIFKTPLTNTPSEVVLAQRYQALASSGMSAIDAFMRVDRSLWLADDALHRTDRASMAAGVEVRVPLLGLPVVRLADSVSGSTKFTLWQSKRRLRQAYRGQLPDYLFTEPKRGWMAPGAKWFRDPVIGAHIKEVYSSSYYSGLDELVNWEAVHKLLEAHINAKTYALNPLWNLLVLQVWAQKHKVIFRTPS